MSLHTNSHRHANGPRGKQRLILALAITSSWFLIELAGGIYTNSLALLADASHMLTDVGALGLSLFALKIANRPATHEKTYGYLRAEILAAFANGIFLILLGFFIFYESYQRFWAPPEVKSLPMLIVAITGLCANLVTAGLLFGSRKENLNLRGAFLHVVGDTLGSVGAILAGILIMTRQWRLADPVVSAIIGFLVLYSSWQLVTESLEVLLEGTPRHLKIPQILKDLGSIRGVIAVHDLHVWSIASGMTAMSCHIVMKTDEDAQMVLAESSLLMREKYRIEHTTIQIEFENWPSHPGDTILELPLHRQ
jgi:cobalt-zinc-cadmium efflux system protein